MVRVHYHILFVAAVLLLSTGLAAGENSLERCIICHSADGNGATKEIPVIAGQKVDYLKAQLVRFRSSDRKHAIMQNQSRYLTDAEIDRIANYFATKVCQQPAKSLEYPVSVHLLANCLNCHGGREPDMSRNLPNLAGQRVGYLVRQLLVFRESAMKTAGIRRVVRTHPIMAEFARNLSTQDILTVANYFNGLGCGPQMGRR
ncbi:MAG: c-type cytochrome [Rhodospirillaceae bacterium]|nr:c-type cytochrome [Rhodospirillaceae bacterium]